MWRSERTMTTLLLIGFTAVACAQTSVAEETVSSAPVLIVCEDPRPQMCTMQYDPVCGVSGGSQRKTYSNACSACSDARVSEYSSGACE